MSRLLLWRHTDRLFGRYFYGRFYHNGVASQGRFSLAVHRSCIFRSILLRFRGRIEIDHSYGLRCHGLCCHSGTTLVAPSGARPQAGARGPAPLVLCRCGSTNHSSADRIVVNSYMIQWPSMFSINCWILKNNSSSLTVLCFFAIHFDPNRCIHTTRLLNSVWW